MKRGFSLIELLVVIVIFSVISYTCYVVYHTLIDSYWGQLESNQARMELVGTQILLQNRVINGRNFVVSANKVEYYELDHQAITSKIFSGFANLDDPQTSKSGFVTKIIPYATPYQLYVGFDENLYAIEKIDLNRVTFVDTTSPKKMSENYSLYRLSVIEYVSGTLTINNEPIMKNLQSCNFSFDNTHLIIELCLNIKNETLCRKWKLLI